MGSEEETRIEFINVDEKFIAEKLPILLQRRRRSCNRNRDWKLKLLRSLFLEEKIEKCGWSVKISQIKK